MKINKYLFNFHTQGEKINAPRYILSFGSCVISLLSNIKDFVIRNRGDIPRSTLIFPLFGKDNVLLPYVIWT